MKAISALARSFALIALALAGLSGSAQARSITDEEKAALSQAVADFDGAMRANDMSKVVSVMPPKLVEALAKESGVDQQTLLKTVAEQSARLMASLKSSSYSIDLVHARFLELSNGTPYVLIPSQSNFDLGSGNVQTNSDTLGMLDRGHWYLLAVSQPSQAQVLTSAYPEFAGVKFNPATTKVAP